jgi:hypothetical protein
MDCVTVMSSMMRTNFATRLGRGIARASTLLAGIAMTASAWDAFSANMTMIVRMTAHLAVRCSHEHMDVDTVRRNADSRTADIPRMGADVMVAAHGPAQCKAGLFTLGL